MAELIINDKDLSEDLKNKIALALGWTEKIENTEGELDGDNYPIINNPVTRDVFLSNAISKEIKSTILRRGRKMLIMKSEQEIDKVNAGNYDHLIL